MSILARLEESLATHISSRLPGLNVYAGESDGFRTLPFAAVFVDSATEIQTTLGNRINETYRAKVIVAVATDIDTSDPSDIGQFTYEVKSAITSIMNNGQHLDSETGLVIHGMGIPRVEKANHSQSRGCLIRIDMGCAYAEHAANTSCAVEETDSSPSAGITDRGGDYLIDRLGNYVITR